jgi:uncharacterized iron-regulated membrane protein
VKRLRPFLLKLHRWTGLTVGILLLIQGLTGATIVFRDEIDRIIHPCDRRRADRIARAGSTDARHGSGAHPDATVNRIEISRWVDGAALFKLTDPHTKALRLIAVDPFRNHILRDGTRAAWPTEWLFAVHHTLLAGRHRRDR